MTALGARGRGFRVLRGTFAFALGAILLVASRAPAEEAGGDEESALERLEERVRVLEAQSASQAEALERADARREAAERRARALADDATPAERIVDWLGPIDFDFALAASYNFNFNNPDSDPNVGFPTSNGRRNNGSTFPAVQHNTFQLDQLDLAIERPIDADNAAGFRVEMLYGVTADPAEGSDRPRLQQAYLSWSPLEDRSIELRAGRWDTPIGAEVIYVGRNFNVTRGLAWFYQTQHHDGLLVSGRTDSGIGWKVGLANNGRAENFDNNNGKSGLVQLGYEARDWFVRATYLLEEGPLIGHFSSLATNDSEDFSHFLDVYAHWDVDDDLSVWANVDWVHTDFDDEDDTETFLLSLAGRRSLTERLGLSLRAEGALFLSGDADIPTEGAIWATKTLDYALTERLGVRGEVIVQHSFAQTPSNILFINGSGNAFNRDTQVIALAQLVYVY